MLCLRLIRNMDVRIRLNPMRENPPHQSEQSVKYRETRRSLLEDTRRGNVDYRTQGIPHLTVQKEDSNRKEIVKRLIQQFENHPNRDS